MTIQIEAVVGQFDAVTRGDFTLAGFNGFIAKLNDFAAVQADQMIVVMLLSQFENGLAAFKIMTRDDTGIIKLVQHAIYRRQPNFFTHINQALVQIFRTDVMALRFLKHFQDF